MKRVASIALVTVILLTVGADAVEIRGERAEVVDGATYTWTPENFAGFYYDADDGIGTESLSMTITESYLEEGSGVIYRTEARSVEFNFEDWGHYYVMGFLGRKRFGGYADGLLYDRSGDPNLLADERLSAVLVDFDGELKMGSGTALDLGQGYRLAVNSIDLEGDRVFVQLYKSGAKVDSGIVSPSNETTQESTYLYRRKLGGTEDIVVIAAHFKNAFKGVEQDLVTVDGIWQIGDTTQSVEVGTEYDRMTIEDVDSQSMTITVKNDRRIALSRDRDVSLMDGIGIRTADQDEISDENPLRFYIYRDV